MLYPKIRSVALLMLVSNVFATPFTSAQGGGSTQVANKGRLAGHANKIDHHVNWRGHGEHQREPVLELGNDNIRNDPTWARKRAEMEELTNESGFKSTAPKYKKGDTYSLGGKKYKVVEVNKKGKVTIGKDAKGRLVQFRSRSS